MTPEYAAKGHKHVDSFITNLPQIYPDQRVLTVEMPTARKGYEMISGKLPFSVVPGNHEYDSNWSDSRYPEGKDGFPYGMQIGRASVRERVCQYVEISVVAVSLKIKYPSETVNRTTIM